MSKINIDDIKPGYTLGHADAAILREELQHACNVSFDSLRDAVAEMTGGIPLEWQNDDKGHQPVPFMNFNSLKRIVDKFCKSRFEVDLEHVGYICCEGDYLDSEEVIEAIKQAGGTVKRGDL